MTKKQLDVLYDLGSGAVDSDELPTRTVNSLLDRGLIEKDWCNQHSNPGADIEYVRLTDAGREVYKQKFL